MLKVLGVGLLCLTSALTLGACKVNDEDGKPNAEIYAVYADAVANGYTGTMIQMEKLQLFGLKKNNYIL